MFKKILVGLLTGLFCCMLLSGCATKTATSGNIIYVNGATTNSGDGSTWEKAFTSLQDALKVAKAKDQIWVAKGTYTPSKDDITASFTMKEAVSIYGGFSGTEKSIEDRDWKNNATVLSGEIGDVSKLTDNSKHVVVGANGTLDGFTISSGYSVRGPAPAGAAPAGGPPAGAAPTSAAPYTATTTSFNSSTTSLTAVTTSYSASAAPAGGPPAGGPPAGGPPAGAPPAGAPPAGGNVGHSTPERVLSGSASTSGNGAGIIIWQTSPTIKNCTITNNTAGKAGGVYIINTAALEKQPTFINCTISNNTSGQRGGGVSLDMKGNAIFIDTIFSNNVCEGKGGAVYNDFGCSPLFENCLFVNNKSGSGAAVGSDGESNPKFSNCTLYGNVASQAGAALYQGTGPFNDPTVINSIIWGNICKEDVRSVYNWNECNTKIDFSLIQDGYVGEKIIDTDPLFVDAASMNFALKEGSPCLTASNTGGIIGFNASLISQRKEADYTALAKNLNSIQSNPTPSLLNLANPLAKADVSAIGNVIYVKANSTGNGSSWANALGSVQEAINYGNAKFVSSGKAVEIWVAKGTYYTGKNRSDSIVLREGVSVYGGFSGTETSLSNRDYNKNETILSADIGVVGDMKDNSYHVLIGSDSAMIDGFTIANGNADKKDGGMVYDNKGGGLLNYLAGKRIVPSMSPVQGFNTTVKNCTFKNNFADEGGASYAYHGSSPIFENCKFNNNSANNGGAVVDRAGINSKYTNCSFVNNTAKYKGGASFVDYGSMATFEACSFENNTSGSAGGAIYAIDRASQAVPNKTSISLIDPTWTLSEDIFTSVLVQNSSFKGNKAGTSGGSIYVYDSSNVKIVNTKFDSNSAKDPGGAISLYSKSTLYQDTKSTFTNNTPENLYMDTTSKVVK